MFRQKLVVEWEALDQALSIVFNHEVKATIMKYFEFKRHISKEKKEPFTREEIERILVELLGTGGNLIVTAFRQKLDELHAEA